MNTFGEKVNRPSVDTLAGSGEQVFTPAPVCALGGMPLRAPPDRPPSPRPALPFVLNKCTIGPAIPTSYPSCPAPPAHPPSRLLRLPLLTSPGVPAAASPRALDPAMYRRGPCGGVRPVRGSVSQPMLPAAGPSPSHRPAPKSAPNCLSPARSPMGIGLARDSSPLHPHQFARHAPARRETVPPVRTGRVSLRNAGAYDQRWFRGRSLSPCADASGSRWPSSP